MRTLAVIVVLVVACKDNDKPKQEAATPVVEATGSGSASGSKAPQVDAAVAARDERCDDPCRYLAETALADVAAKVKTTCGSEWPAASGKDCAQLDYQRNCIFATAGYTFKKAHYRAAFGMKPWYKARDDFKDSDLSAVATANVAALKQQAMPRTRRSSMRGSRSCVRASPRCRRS
jgi:hypothetical protein